MDIKSKIKKAHMRAAFVYSECSTAIRLKVGCVIVKDDRLISIGYNGMPSGWTNECENIIGIDDVGTPILETKPETLHAESNAIAKLASSTESGRDAALFCTVQPCLDCAKLIHQTGIKQVYYVHPYRKTDGLEFLKKCKIHVEQMEHERP